MTTKEKIVRKSLEEATKERDRLNDIVFDNPLIQAFALEKETLEAAKKDYKNDPGGCVVYLDQQIKERDRLMKKANDQINNSNEYIARIAQLDVEISELNTELFIIEARKSR